MCSDVLISGGRMKGRLGRALEPNEQFAGSELLGPSLLLGPSGYCLLEDEACIGDACSTNA